MSEKMLVVAKAAAPEHLAPDWIDHLTPKLIH